MSITNYLKIVKISSPDRSLTQFFRGVAFFKNVSNKKMRTQILHPKILILEDASAFASNDQQLVSMEAVLGQESEYAELFLRKVAKLEANLLLVEKTMSEKLISELAARNITAFLNVKRSVLDLISRVSKAKIFRTIDQVASYRKNVIGQCQDFSMKTIGSKTLVSLKALDGHLSGGSVFLSSLDETELKLAKSALRRLAVDCRNALLESELLQSLSLEATDSVLLDHHATSTSFLYITLDKKLCMPPQHVTVDFYISGDSSLGERLMRFGSQAEETCECGEVLMTHRHVFMQRNGFIQVTKKRMMDRKGNKEERDQIFVRMKCRKCGEYVGSEVPLTNFAWEFSFYKFLSNFFIGAQRRHKTHICESDFFRDFLFMFTIQNVELTISYEVNTVYELKSAVDKSDKTDLALEDLYSSLKFTGLIDLKAAGNEVAGRVLKEIEELQKDLETEVEKEENKTNKPYFDSLKSDLSQIASELTLDLSHLSSLTDFDLPHFLILESHRRHLFFSICKAKSAFENAKSSLKKDARSFLKRTPKTLDIYLERSQSSMSPSPSYSSLEIESFRSSQSKGKRSLTPIRGVFYHLAIDASRSRFIHPKAASRKMDPVLKSRNFEYLQKGALTLPLCVGDVCIPVDEDDPMSILAYTLSSNSYDNQYGKLARTAQELNEYIQSELLYGDDSHFTDVFSTYEETDINAAENKGEMQRLYGPSLTFHVTVYYPRQFQALQVAGTSPDQFILSICKGTGERVHPGRSRAEFVFSHDGKFVLKLVSEKDFGMFMSLAPNYFRYMYKRIYRSMPSLLVRTVGAYRVSIRNRTTGTKRIQWILLSENVTYGVPETSRIYDLKGSLNSRRCLQPGEEKTKMDLNFLEEMKGIPLLLSRKSKKMLDAALWNDARFLSHQNVIDYSLLIAINEEDQTIVAGIIDYGQQYTFEKVMENTYKKVAFSEPPTVTNPKEYGLRFRTQIAEEYFTALKED